MGRYLLDDKTKAMNQKFQDKKTGSVSKADKVAQLRAAALAKRAQK
jgi:hypothetical protein